MFDKKEYDLKIQKEREEQIREIAKYLEESVKINAHIRDLPISAKSNKESMEYVKNIPISNSSRPIKEVADEMVEHVYRNIDLIQHPRFFSYVASSVSPYSLLGSILTDIYNPNACGFGLASEACIIEEKLISYLGSLAGYNESLCGGLFSSGGSISNMSCLVAAREEKLKDEDYSLGTAYCSDQTHICVVKGLKMIGIKESQIRIIPTDENFKMRMDLLEEEIKKDIKNGRKPFAVVGTIGTTNTGSIDPLDKIGDICKKYNLWFHIDGAYGGSILFSEIYRNLAKGVEKSDSIAWDLHKWAMQTYSASAYIVKNKDYLLNAFSEYPEYLDDLKNEEHNDAWNLGPELSRPHRALKFWMTIQAMGTDLLSDVIDYSFYNANVCKEELEKDDHWEILSGPWCSTLNFRYVEDGLSEEELDDLCLKISKKCLLDNYAHIVTTTIKGKKTLRMCLINQNTNTDDVRETIAYLSKIAKEIAKGE